MILTKIKPTTMIALKNLTMIRNPVKIIGEMILGRAFTSSTSVVEEKPWKQSAVVLAVAPLEIGPEGERTVGFLKIKRSKKSRLLPGGVGFPGGAVSPADISKRWVELFQASGVNLANTTFMDKNAHRPSIYSKDGNSYPNSTFSKEISLRITAIRETFEECGILLCRAIDSKNESDLPYEFEGLKDKDKIIEWQNKVNADPEEFFNLCEKLTCVPDLYALTEWSVWLTPTTFPTKARHHSIFYMALLPYALPSVVYADEVADANWATAKSLLLDHENGEHILMPPQFYEMSRLKNKKAFEQFHNCLEARRRHGIELYFPVIVGVKDGVLALLPGDDLYPQQPNFYISSDKDNLDFTIEELRNSSTNFHRVEGHSDGTVNYRINVCRYGHIYEDD